MNATGMLRTIDHLGRMVIPVGVRRPLDIEARDDVEIYLNNDQIVLSKYQGSCLFCDSQEGLTEFHDRLICATCKSELSAVK